MRGKSTILLVDDDAMLRTGMRFVLHRSGYAVMEAADGFEAVKMVKKEVPSVILLDVEMPRMDGWQTLAELRKMRVDCPILMFTQVEDVPSRVRGLDGGADDYLCKPCTPQELLARIRAVLRRKGATQNSSGRLLRLGEVTVDLERRTAMRAGLPLRLSRTDFSLLELLDDARGLPVAREMIAERIWAGSAGASQALDTHVWRLRKKIGDEGTAPRWIKNVPGYGYLLATE